MASSQNLRPSSNQLKPRILHPRSHQRDWPDQATSRSSCYWRKKSLQSCTTGSTPDIPGMDIPRTPA
eukprot:g34180.t1